MSWTAADVGKKCKTSSGKRGTVKFVGEGAFAPGTWVGVELATPDGKHDGEVKGKRYFKCKPKHGVMLKPEQVKKAVAKGTAAAKKPGAAGRPAGARPKKADSATKPKKTRKPGMAGVVNKASRAAKPRPGAAGKRPARPSRPSGAGAGAGAGARKSPKKAGGAAALAAKRKALAAAKRGGGGGSKKTPVGKKGPAGKRPSTAGNKRPSVGGGNKRPGSAAPKEPDANELLRQKILMKLRGEAPPDIPAADDGAGAGDAAAAPAAPAGGDSGGDASGTGNALKDKIAARLAAIRNDGTSPVTSPTNSAGGPSPAASPARGIQRNKDHVPAHLRCTTPEQVATLIQALCRGYLIRVEQFNLLDASVKLLRVEDNQWVVVGQGVAEVTDEVVPYVQVIGWTLDQRAWESTKSLRYETPIRPGDTLTREDDGLGPPIYILNDEYDDIVRGLEFALPQDEEAFEEMYAFARRDQAALIIQSAYRGAKVRWNLKKTRRGQAGGKKARNPALPTPTATPDHHPPIGALVKVKRPMKKSKIGRLISYATFTGKFTIQYADKTREIDLDKTKYSVVTDDSAK